MRAITEFEIAARMALHDATRNAVLDLLSQGWPGYRRPDEVPADERRRLAALSIVYPNFPLDA